MYEDFRKFPSVKSVYYFEWEISYNQLQKVILIVCDDLDRSIFKYEWNIMICAMFRVLATDFLQ